MVSCPKTLFTFLRLLFFWLRDRYTSYVFVNWPVIIIANITYLKLQSLTATPVFRFVATRWFQCSILLAPSMSWYHYRFGKIGLNRYSWSSVWLASWLGQGMTHKDYLFKVSWITNQCSNVSIESSKEFGKICDLKLSSTVIEAHLTSMMLWKIALSVLAVDSETLSLTRLKDWT